MTDEEKAEEYLKKNKICNNENWEVGGKYCYTLCKQSYLDGLAEGRKETTENFSVLEKENAELKEENNYLTQVSKELNEKLKEDAESLASINIKAQNEKLKCCGNCINRGLEKYIAYPCSECKRWHRELDSDKWEFAE